MKRTLPAVLAAATLLFASACGTSQPSADSDSSGDSSGKKITLTDDAGRKVELDGPAKRVASLEWQQTEDLLTLGVEPVAVADKKDFANWVSAEKIPESTVDIGTRTEPNLEALFSANPDLVVVEAERGDAVIKQLEKYDVPVLVSTGADTKDPIAKMKKTFNLMAKVTGTTDKADEVLKEFDEKLADSKKKLEKLPADQRRFVFMDAYIQGSNLTVRPYGQGSLIGELGEKIGLKNAWTGKVDKAYGTATTDAEGISAVKDATVFYPGTAAKEDVGTSKAWMPELEKNSLWNNATFVKEDRLKAFPDAVWMFGGPRSSMQVLDAFVAGLT